MIFKQMKIHTTWIHIPAHSYPSAFNGSHSDVSIGDASAIYSIGSLKFEAFSSFLKVCLEDICHWRTLHRREGKQRDYVSIAPVTGNPVRTMSIAIY